MNPAIEAPFEAHDKLDDVGLLQELLGDVVMIPPETKRMTKRPSVGLANMSDEEYRAYKAQKQAERRAALKERETGGSVKFDSASTREALADAALLLLATGGPGADAVMSYLSRIYHDQVGAPLTIRSWARSGKLKPKLMHIASNAK